MNTIITAAMIAVKMEQCYNAARDILEPADWQDNVDQWKHLIEMHQKVHPGATVMESVLSLLKKIDGAYYSIMMLLAVAYELITNQENAN